ncbi:MAG: hypothetical protein GY950_00540, partial [bacterium]|nr:hypothetical protein [bacterium]
DVMIPSHTLDFQEELLERLLFKVKKGVIDEKRIDESLERILTLKGKHPVEGNQAGPGKNPGPLRKHIVLEQEIADRSITLLRNRAGVLPLEKDKKILILEWQKKVTGPSITENEKQGRSMIRPISSRHLKNSEVKILEPADSIPGELLAELGDYAYVIVFTYSRTGKIRQQQTASLKTLFQHRRDTIVVSLENPYEIKNIPSVDTFLVTYGFRQVQVEALFKVLTGDIKPHGKLPVKIDQMFPRNYGLCY